MLKRSANLFFQDKFLVIILCSISFLILGSGWLNNDPIIRGDWRPYVFNQYFLEEPLLPYAWRTTWNGGVLDPVNLAQYPIRAILVMLVYMGADYSLATKVLYFLPFFPVIMLGTFFLGKELFKNSLIGILAVFFVGFNHYTLSIPAGGAMTFGMGFAFLPWLWLFSLKGLSSGKVRYSLLSAICFLLIFAYDARVAYLGVFLTLGLFLYYMFTRERKIKEASKFPLISGGLVVLYLGYFLPIVFIRNDVLEPVLNQSFWIRALTTWEGLSLLNNIPVLWNHPAIPLFNNYPIAILYLFPIIIFGSLLLFPKDRRIIFLVVVALIGLFLTKGSSPPFEQIYYWLFENFPGFEMFREPSKFYPLIILSYSLLLAKTLHFLPSKLQYIKSGKNFSIKGLHRLGSLVIIAMLFFWGATNYYTAYSANNLEGGNGYHTRKIPEDYVKLNFFISAQSEYFKTLYIPELPPVIPNSANHPFITLDVFKPELKKHMLSKLSQGDADTLLQFASLYSVKYIIIPPENEIIPTHSRTDINNFIEILDNTPRLSKVDLNLQSGRIYEITHYIDRLFFVMPTNVIPVFPDSPIVQDFSIEKEGYYTILLEAVDISKLKIDNVTYALLPMNASFAYSSEIYLQKGIHTLKIDPHPGYHQNWYFDDKEDLQDWQAMTPANQGNAFQKLEVIRGILSASLYNSTWGWKGINSPLIPTFYGEKCDWMLKVSGSNVHDAHIYIAEFDYYQNQTLATYSSGIGNKSFDWEEIIVKYDIKKKDTNYIQLKIWHGSETLEPLPNKLFIDYAKIICYKPVDVSSIKIHDDNRITITQDVLGAELSAMPIDYKQIEPTKYAVMINSTRPFILAYAQNYDKSWKAVIDGTEINAIPFDYSINGFYIEKTGFLTIMVQYDVQKFFMVGSLVSMISLTLSISLFLLKAYPGLIYSVISFIKRRF